MSARQRKYHFLRSDVLPASNYPLPEPEAGGEQPRASGYPEAPWKRFALSCQVDDEDEDPKIDTQLVRQMQLSSNMFGPGARCR